jgi:hypothetical protein
VASRAISAQPPQLPQSVSRQDGREEVSALGRSDGTFEQVRVSADRYPVVLQFPEFKPPAHLDRRAYAGGIETGSMVVIYMGGASPEDVARELGTKTLRFVDTFRRATFQQLLLKIAYGWAVLSLGLEKISDVYVLPPLFEGTNDIGRWLGCDGQKVLPNAFHAAAVSLVDGEIICRVRLFSRAAPEYMVVVGRAIST